MANYLKNLTRLQAVEVGEFLTVTSNLEESLEHLLSYIKDGWNQETSILGPQADQAKTVIRRVKRLEAVSLGLKHSRATREEVCRSLEDEMHRCIERDQAAANMPASKNLTSGNLVPSLIEKDSNSSSSSSSSSSGSSMFSIGELEINNEQSLYLRKKKKRKKRRKNDREGNSKSCSSPPPPLISESSSRVSSYNRTESDLGSASDTF